MTPERKTMLAALALVVEVALVVALTGGVGAAQVVDNTSNTSDYYGNASTNVDNATWFEGNENATLENTTNMLTRVQTYIIGTDTTSGGALSAAGSLLAGLLVFGAAVSGSAGVRVGITGGAVMGTSLVAGLVLAGLAPSWLWAVILLAIGLITARTVFEILR